MHAAGPVRASVTTWKARKAAGDLSRGDHVSLFHGGQENTVFAVRSAHEILHMHSA
jgi:hypothetical protein